MRKYVRRHIHEVRTMRESVALEEQVLAGIDAPRRMMTREDWERFKRSLRERATTAKESKPGGRP